MTALGARWFQQRMQASPIHTPQLSILDQGVLDTTPIRYLVLYCF